LGRALAKALAAGDELLTLFAAPAPDVAMEQVEALVAARAAALEAAGPQGAGAPSAELERLAAQQRLLERQLGALLDSLRSGSLGAQAVRHRVQGVNRLLDPGPRSRMLNTTR
jgi:hypothetical protein